MFSRCYSTRMNCYIIKYSSNTLPLIAIRGTAGMDLLIKNGLVYHQGTFHHTSIAISGDKIVSVGCEEHHGGVKEIDVSGKYVLPGFVDIHTHGSVGVDINHAASSDIHKVSRFFASQGVTGWLASIVTDTEENTLRAIQSICEAMDHPEPGAELLGIHLEGPFLSPEYKGAMAGDLLRKADWSLLQKYQQAAGGRIRYITVSPEVDGVPELIKKACQLGIVVAIGHSGADYETAMACIEHGARCATHIFNAMKGLHHHKPAISGAVLESDIYCEAICDGRHLHPGIVRLLLKAKGTDRVIAVTDSIMAAGLCDGRYVLGANAIEVINGDARLMSDGTRAGSTLTMIQALRNLKAFTGKPLEELIPLLTINPAKLLGLEQTKGTIDSGKDADLVILDVDLSVETTLVDGKIAYAKKRTE